MAYQYQSKIGRRKRPLVRLRNWRPGQMEIALAYLTLFLAVFKVPGLTLIPIGSAPAMFLISVMLFVPTLKLSKSARHLLWSALFAAFTGLAIRFVSIDPELNFSSESQVLEITAWVLATPAVVIATLWAFERVDVIRGFVVLLAGASASAMLNSNGFEWKGSTGIYLTGLALALVARRNLFWARSVLLGAAALNATSDARTMAMVALSVFIFTFLRPRNVRWIGRRPKRSMVGLIVVFIFMSYAMVQAMVAGFFGEDIQRRTIDQTSGGRDIITSGRSEWAVTLELFKNIPFGFGTGVTPTVEMQSEAILAVQEAGGDYTAPYWLTNVFAERLDLHSTLANLWSHFGIGGVIMAIVMGSIIVSSFPLCVAVVRSVGTMPLFVVLVATWDLLFSPMADSDRIMVGLIAACVLLNFKQQRRGPFLPPAVPQAAVSEAATATNQGLTTRQR